MDMSFYWLRDRVFQKQIHVYWNQGTENYADYPTTHQSPNLTPHCHEAKIRFKLCKNPV